MLRRSARVSGALLLVMCDTARVHRLMGLTQHMQRSYGAPADPYVLLALPR